MSEWSTKTLCWFENDWSMFHHIRNSSRSKWSIQRCSIFWRFHLWLISNSYEWCIWKAEPLTVPGEENSPNTHEYTFRLLQWAIYSVHGYEFCVSKNTGKMQMNVSTKRIIQMSCEIWIWIWMMLYDEAKIIELSLVQCIISLVYTIFHFSSHFYCATSCCCSCSSTVKSTELWESRSRVEKTRWSPFSWLKTNMKYCRDSAQNIVECIRFGRSLFIMSDINSI